MSLLAALQWHLPALGTSLLALALSLSLRASVCSLPCSPSHACPCRQGLPGPGVFGSPSLLWGHQLRHQLALVPPAQLNKGHFPPRKYQFTCSCLGFESLTGITSRDALCVACTKQERKVFSFSTQNPDTTSAALAGGLPGPIFSWRMVHRGKGAAFL